MTDLNLWTGLIGGLAGGAISLITSYVVARLNIRQQSRTWDSNFVIEYEKLMTENELAARRLARQFAIGLIIVRDSNDKTLGKFFIPYQCRVSIGRNPDNDIIIDDRIVSRDHGVFYYKRNKIYFSDLSPLNVTSLNGTQIKGATRIRNGDELLVGDTKLVFNKLR
jgi:hypothetical protein